MNDKTQPAATTPESDRIDRRRFIVWSFLFLPMLILLTLASRVGLDGVELAQVTGAGFATDAEIQCAVLLNNLLVVATLFYIWAAIKRLHDMNVSGWWSVLYFFQGQVIPFFIVLFHPSVLSDFHWYESPALLFFSLHYWYLFPIFNIALCFINGTKGTNKYGVEPN